jgi:hypothetical protein
VTSHPLLASHLVALLTFSVLTSAVFATLLRDDARAGGAACSPSRPSSSGAGGGLADVSFPS